MSQIDPPGVCNSQALDIGIQGDVACMAGRDEKDLRVQRSGVVKEGRNVIGVGWDLATCMDYMPSEGDREDKLLLTTVALRNFETEVLVVLAARKHKNRDMAAQK